MNTLSQIQSEITTMPVNLQAEVLDFVRFVKLRRGLPIAELESTQTLSSDSESPFFQALTQAGFVGCIDTHEQLSSHYKNQLDFSSKTGAQR